MMRRSPGALAIAMAATLAACSSSSRKTTTTEITTALQYCTSAAGASIDGAARCLNWSAAYAAAYKAVAAQACESTRQDVDVGRKSYDPPKGTACVNAIKALTDCAALQTMITIRLDPSSLAALVPACEGALKGAVAPSGGCYEDADCASGWCNRDACPGTCTPPLTAGQDCTFGGGRCAAGLKCWDHNGGGQHTCESPAAAGESCSNAPCADGLTCDASVCVARNDVGGSCPCKEGLYCEGSTCAALKTSGTCSHAGECAVGYKCAMQPVLGTCKKYGGLDEPCVVGESTCAEGYRCDAGTSKCALQPGVSEPCDAMPGGESSRVCVEGYCDPGTLTCKAYAPVGQPCESVACYRSYCDAQEHVCKEYDRCSGPT